MVSRYPNHSQQRSGTFSPEFALGPRPSITPTHGGLLSSSASPGTSSPTSGTTSLTRIVIAQVYLLLGAIKDDKDRAKRQVQVEQLRKLIDDNGMEVFSKYFSRLVASNASQIFPGVSRSASNQGNYSILVTEMSKIAREPDQAAKIAESIETGSEDIFRDFDLSTFMEHFKLDALEKTILALAFKTGTRSDLKTKADAILSTNFPTFVNIISRPDYAPHADLSPSFIAAIVDRYIQGHPPNFNAMAKSELSHKVKSRWPPPDQAPPMEVLAALDLIRVLGEKQPNALALYIQRTGPEFTRDEETCYTYLQKRAANIQLTEEQVSAALTYTTVSITYRHNPAALVAALRRVVPESFSWQEVVSYFDQRDVRVSSEQFLRLYNALLPIAQAQNDDAPFDIQFLWGGAHWDNPETQLSFICAFASLSPEQLDASTIPNSQPTFTLEDYTDAPAEVRDRAVVAVKHPLVSGPALAAIFQVALHSLHASQSTEAKRLFQGVVVPNLDIFIVSAFGVPKPWPPMAVETLNPLFESFLYRRTENYDFVLYSLWKKDKSWVKERLSNAHATKPMDLGIIAEHVIKHNWLDELVYLPTGFGYDLAALAHAEGYLDLTEWAHNGARDPRSLLHFLGIKANHELQYQRSSDDEPVQKTTTSLQVKTVSALLQILEDAMPRSPVPDLIALQRLCITAYPRLINYGEGYDDIIDANGRDGNALPPAANLKMEEHYKKMYSDETEVKVLVQQLEEYKRSQNPLDQDIFACMIHGLFDEYSHFVDYPLEALATTAVLFGGVISKKLISELPLKIGLGMILEAVRDHPPDHSMYKFGLQALMQLFPRLREWAGFCTQLLAIPGLQGTEAWRRAEDVVREDEEDRVRNQNGSGSGEHNAADALVNGGDAQDTLVAPFSALGIDPPPPGILFEDPVVDVQDKVQFGLNNLTASSLQSTFKELEEVLEERHQQWFASHLVEERAKMQPNFHHVYLDFLKLFERQSLWAEVLRQTYISVTRMLNSESTASSTMERSHLKHLGAWLGLLTIARDKPILHRNIAFKQLLIEAHDTKRLVVVIPFVCKVLIQGARSTIFRPPNPWLMAIIHLLIELYHDGELKLNQKFEIEVLCKDLSLDHKSIEPSRELEERGPAEDAAQLGQLVVQDTLDHFDSLSLNGMASTVPTGLSPHNIPVTIPDISHALTLPPTNEMVVNHARLHDIVRTALTRALQETIQPVVDRSVTIAAISTQQMIHKDFATEPDEDKLRQSAISMVKATAGSLALVTSKEPLRATITNGMRNLARDLPQGLPEGTIIMCVNLNLDLACGIIEKQAEDRAVPEIEEMIAGEVEARRRHRQQQPGTPFIDPGLSRWAMTIPHPYKLTPNLPGLNPEQMAIYEDFARQPRGTAQSGPTHAASASDATRSIANEVLQESYSAVPSVPTPAETPSVPHLSTQLPYAQHAGLTNGRQAAPQGPLDSKALVDKMQKILTELERAATESTEESFPDLPRPHQVMDAVDTFTQLIISQESVEFVAYAADRITSLLFNPQITHTLFIESLIHILDQLLQLSHRLTDSYGLDDKVKQKAASQPPAGMLKLPLLKALLPTGILNLQSIDEMMASALSQQEEWGLSFLEQLFDIALFNERPCALYADFLQSLSVSWDLIAEDPNSEVSQRLKAKFMGSGIPAPIRSEGQDGDRDQQEQAEYLFEEWLHLVSNPHSTDKVLSAMVNQMRARGPLSSKDDFLVFVRVAIDSAVTAYEHAMHLGSSNHDALDAADGLVKLVCIFARESAQTSENDQTTTLAILDAVMGIVTVVLNHHHLVRGEMFCQRVFLRIFTMLLHGTDGLFAEAASSSRQEFLLSFAKTMSVLNPERFPGFAYGWLTLVAHRRFAPELLLIENKRGWAPFTKLVSSALKSACEPMKGLEVPEVAKEFYRAAIKLVLIIQHDFPEYIASSSSALLASVPPHCRQLRNVLINCTPAELALEHTESQESSLSYLRDAGLLEILEQVLQDGPSEDAIAHLTHAISRSGVHETTFGNVPLSTNTRLVDEIVGFIGHRAVNRYHRESLQFSPGSPDYATISLLVHELQPEARYFFLSSIVDRLGFPGPLTEYFTIVLFELFGRDANDLEEADIRQQIVRILLERVSGFWPQPPGLVRAVLDLIRDDKHMFFEQPFIKADRETAEQFLSIRS
ncbi:CCR4-Not complex component [Microdochium trichocladiopsis]|uniref:General negative regulator of transcription subunit 1 n=1 Tax=Microdochium trichocladiopsis TaxID=1682393 RepID=A0A9P8XVM3_9PEZI|nr:CCR4-Not complex component [Microdochium trichocladiopsis]KAH7021003.1 CCR4-Not complex component [Microdochium trichocladiopsis]